MVSGVGAEQHPSVPAAGAVESTGNTGGRRAYTKKRKTLAATATRELFMRLAAFMTKL
jgi:hypothetical protein